MGSHYFKEIFVAWQFMGTYWCVPWTQCFSH